MLGLAEKILQTSARGKKQSLDELKNKEELESLQMELDSTKKENELIKSAVSWKITKPLRELRKKN